MKIEVLKENFKRGLDIVAAVVGKQVSLPILDNVLIETKDSFLELVATDLEIAVKVWMLAKIVSKGKIAVPAKVLSGTVSSLPNEKIILEEMEKKVQVQCRNFKTVLQNANVEEFPLIPTFESAITFQVDCQKFCRGISQVVDMIQLSRSRSEISGVYVQFQKNRLTMVATDSFRLAEKKIFLEENSTQEASFILPQKPAKELISVLQERPGMVTIRLAPNQVMFEVAMPDTDHPEIQIVSRLIDGEYPNYEEIIPKKFTTSVTVKRDEIMSHVKAAALFAGKISEVRLNIDQATKQLKVLAQDPDVGTHASEIEVASTGEDIEVSFNYKYLLDGLLQMKSSEVELQVNQEDGPCLIRPVGDESYVYVIMPIKL
jgi:DNA polymerase-3 subunit beta